MFDIGWSEMAVVVVIALLVLGPKQLPEALKTVTKFTRQARRYARDFRSGIDNIVREAELEEAREALKSVKGTNPAKALSDIVDPTGEVDEEVRDLEKTARKAAAPDQFEEKASGKPEEVEARIVGTGAAPTLGNAIRPPAGPDTTTSPDAGSAAPEPATAGMPATAAPAPAVTNETVPPDPKTHPDKDRRRRA
ncbi:MAG: twin-arginine translocase subunit TatB [Rhodospirillales bacterium]|nr:twin-arginine translocase subunit TatB [Rhodospirillales bacterium]